MRSRTKMFMILAAAAMGVTFAAAAGYMAGQNDDLVELDAVVAQSEGAGAPTVVYEPVPAGEADSSRGSERAGWRENKVRVGREEAQTAARARFENTRVVHAELDEEDGYFLWEVLLQRADGRFIEVFVDAGDGRVVGFDLEDSDD
ncbi:MAG TPA: PepSY domain-containing protein [Actinomycetota bacterium]|jgi:uncharacterized membrane protein YkoI|nr:PepSY domain-containing protein [Actinomycetota bacterium]